MKRLEACIELWNRTYKRKVSILFGKIAAEILFVETKKIDMEATIINDYVFCSL